MNIVTGFFFLVSLFSIRHDVGTKLDTRSTRSGRFDEKSRNHTLNRAEVAVFTNSRSSIHMRPGR